MKLNITVEGHTTGDLELALEELSRLVHEGYRMGRDSNDTGEFVYAIEGREVESYKIKRNDELMPDSYTCYEDAAEAANPGDSVVGLCDEGYEVNSTKLV